MHDRRELQKRTNNTTGSGEELVEAVKVARVERLSELVVAEGNEGLDFEGIQDAESAGCILVGRIEARKARLLLHYSAELSVLNSLRLQQRKDSEKSVMA